MDVETVINIVLKERKNALRKFNEFNSTHEGYAVILEEMDELWDLIKRQRQLGVEQFARGVTEEAKQVAAMAIQFIIQYGG